METTPLPLPEEACRPADARSRALAAGARSSTVVGRYWSKVVTGGVQECWPWVGAISGRGHGRFWVGRRSDGPALVVIAHRFGWALAHPSKVYELPPVVAHTCDNPICQNPGHWTASTFARNRAEWSWRRHVVAGPLRDTRGARGRSHELRAAARTGQDAAVVSAQGVRPVDAGQQPLW